VNIQQLLLAGQVLVVVLIYVFVWRVMRTARRDVVAPFQVKGRGGRGGVTAAPAAVEESTIIPARDVAAARRDAGLQDARLVVVSSDVLRAGVPYVVGGGGLTVGRAADNDVVVEDSTASSHHAKFIAPDTVLDLGSTNGTFVNGQRVSGRQRLRPGSEVAIGSTRFRFEVPR
jgi:hypothetical protein